MENIKRKIIEEKTRELQKTVESIKENLQKAIENKEEWTPFNYLLDHYGTPKTIKDYKSGEISAQETAEKITKRAIKENKKELENELKHLEAIEQAEEVESIQIDVEWKKSRMWGANPTTTVIIYKTNDWERYTGKASGCGYDKESAAIASACNQSKVLRKIFAQYKENKLKEDYNADQGKYSYIDNRDAICYGFGYSAIPYFEGGVGSNCFWKGFELAGYKVHEHHGKHFDSYTITKV